MFTTGICEVHFSQAGNANFLAATTVQRGYTIFRPATITVPARLVSIGGGHSCALTSIGGVRCWGYNNFGQLGDGTTTNRASAVDVIGLYRGYVSVWTGAYHSCALSSVGGVRCWGLNTDGQLGDGTTISRLTPIDVFGMISGIAGIATGDRSSCAITIFGGLRCWGHNGFGQLGDGTLISRLYPTDVLGLASGVAQIAMGLGHACVLTSTGGLKCWGDNSSGQLGDGTTLARLTAVDVSGLTSGITTLALGALHGCAITSTGGLKCWGSNLDGRLGDGSTLNRLLAVNVSGLLAGITNLSLGAGHSCAMTSTGGLKCWGNNSDGRLGDGTTLSRLTPVDVSGWLSGMVALAAGLNNSCGITAAGALQCWGNNTYGQLGNGTFINSASNYLAAAVQFAVAASSAPQSIVFPIISGQTFVQGGTITLSATSTSGLALLYSSLTANICSVASNIVTMLSAGTCTIRATQLGDSIFSAAVAVDRSFVLDAFNGVRATTSVQLVSSRTSAIVGQLINLTASIIGGTPTGTITFTDTTAGTGVNAVVMCNTVPLSGNFATCTVPASSRAAGTRTYAASYSGDARNAGSSMTYSQVITAGSAALIVNNQPVRPSAGQSVTFTAQATLSAGISTLGTVSFTRNGSAISGCSNVAMRALPDSTTAAVGTCTVSSIAAGDAAYAANYAGDTNNGTATTSVALSVAASGPLDYSDLWWGGQSENGWGLTIMQKGLTQFNAFYVYGADGKPLWYVMPGGSWNADFTVFSGALYAPQSSQLGAYDSTRFVVGASSGTATLTFTSASTARFDYTINGVTATKQIVRQPFGVPDPAPRIVTTDLWWGGTMENGWGFALAQQERTIFGIWFTYDTAGKGTWLVMPGGSWSGSTFSGKLYTTTSSAWLGTTYDASQFKVTEVGSVSLAFSDADNATMTYTIGSATQVKQISRQPF
jgi:alpha-tubulin suppressor-like RCC1 family protein